MTRMEFNTTNAPIVPLRLLFIGPFGVGKTYAIGYLSKRLTELTGKGIKLFDFDLGWQTLKSAGFSLDTTSYLVNPEKKGEAFEEFDHDFHEYLAEPGKYGGFGIDNLTTFQSCGMDYVFSINKIQRRLGILANENDYGVLVTTLTQVLPQILQISRHSVFVMTAHTRMMESKDTGEVRILPAISGRSLPSQIGGWFNEVWFFKAEGYRGDVQRLVQTASGNQVDCKSQIAGMPFELPVLVAIEKALMAYGLNQNPSEETLKLLEPHFPKVA